MNAGKGLDDDSASTKVTGLQSGVLTAAALAVVVVSNDNPAEAGLLVGAGSVCMRGRPMDMNEQKELRQS